MVTNLALPHIRALEAYQAVDPVEVMAQKTGISPEKIIRLNGNENPYGTSPKVIEALGKFTAYNHYPDPGQRRLRERLAQYVGVGPEYIVAGNGSDELIDLVLRIFLGPGESIIEPSPTFGMYAFCARLCGGGVVVVPRDERFEIEVEAVQQAMGPQVKAILLASPNNPTGNLASEGQIRRLLELECVVVVDETYHEFCGQTVIPLVHEYPNLIVLRTLSKWAGLAGLRIGLGVMHPDVASLMMRMKPPYNVNLAAEIALLVSLDDREWLMEKVNSIVAERDRMFSLLKALPGVIPWPSQANFILCQLPQGWGRKTLEGLAQRGIFVRYFSEPRLIDCVRISVGLSHETDALITALKSLLKE